MKRRRVEIFSAGCAACEATVSMVHRLACDSCDVHVLDMHDKKVAAKAKRKDPARISCFIRKDSSGAFLVTAL